MLFLSGQQLAGDGRGGDRVLASNQFPIGHYMCRERHVCLTELGACLSECILRMEFHLAATQPSLGHFLFWLLKTMNQ